MSSIFDFGETPITREYLESLKFDPVSGGREFVFRSAGRTAGGKWYNCKILYRKRKPNARKGEPHHHVVFVSYESQPNTYGSKTSIIKRTYKNIRYESELIGLIRAIEDEFGINIAQNKYNPKYYWSNYVEEL